MKVTKKPHTKCKKLKKIWWGQAIKKLYLQQIRARGLSNICCLQPTSKHQQVLLQCAYAPFKLKKIEIKLPASEIQLKVSQGQNMFCSK